jgi:hypothetical protein
VAPQPGSGPAVQPAQVVQGRPGGAQCRLDARDRVADATIGDRPGGRDGGPRPGQRGVTGPLGDQAVERRLVQAVEALAAAQLQPVQAEAAVAAGGLRLPPAEQCEEALRLGR